MIQPINAVHKSDPSGQSQKLSEHLGLEVMDDNYLVIGPVPGI